MHFFSLSILILIQINWRFVILSKKYFLAFLISEECPFCHICPFMICTVINLHISNSFRMHTYAVGFIFSSRIWINVSNFFLYRLFVCCLFLHRLYRLCLIGCNFCFFIWFCFFLCRLIIIFRIGNFWFHRVFFFLI